MNNRGFTFIEVMVAMLIFTLAVLAAIDITRGAVRSTRDARTITQATWLLQKVMVELETRIESVGMDKGCDKKKDGRFEPPYEKYSWVTYCNEIDFQISATAAAQQGEDESEASTKENMIQKLIMQTASKYVTKSLRELHAEVLWEEGKNKRKVDVTTHFVRYDQPLQVPSLGGIGGAP